MTKEELRNEILCLRPGWKGRIWIYRYGVTVRGVGGMFFMRPLLDDLDPLELIEDLEEECSPAPTA
jgi:hypothetical protein